MEQNTEKATLLPLLDCNARCPFCSTRVYTEKGVVSPADFEAGSRRTIKDYTQADYYGLYAFLHRSYLVKTKTTAVLAEKFLPGKVDFESVFTREKGATAPHLPGAKEIMEPTFARIAARS